ncbi:uncharacterized protein LOC135383501 [Ornithodoros turicata]|uniref:uncharacterized protein LOC135383501 n=1 Tax=Ornithodoros turicata TaxID=34597 RepID=UPI003138B867
MDTDSEAYRASKEVDGDSSVSIPAQVIMPICKNSSATESYPTSDVEVVVECTVLNYGIDDGAASSTGSTSQPVDPQEVNGTSSKISTTTDGVSEGAADTSSNITIPTDSAQEGASAMDVSTVILPQRDSTRATSQNKRGAKKRKYSPQTERRIARLQEKVNRYRKALNRLKAKEQRTNVTKEDSLRVLKGFVPSAVYTLLRSQVALCSVKKQGRRWSEEMQKFALKIYFHGPRAYRFLACVMTLPCVTIRRWLSRIRMKPGIIPGVIQIIQKATEHWARREKACCILLDEMSLSKVLHYDPGEDIIVGFADDGTQRTPRIANVALVM